MRPAVESWSPGIPVRETLPVRLSRDDRRDLRSIVSRVLQEDPRVRDLRPFGPLVGPGLVEGPSLLVPDHSGIALREATGVPALEYRLLALGSPGDMLLLGATRCERFEELFSRDLGLGPVDVLSLAPGHGPLWLRALHEPEVLQALAARAAHHRHLNVVPYMGYGGVWRLAAWIASASRARVAVAAPPPVLTQRVNDKIWFARRVADVLGTRAAPPSVAAHGPVALAARVRWFARRFDRVCLKLPSSAGSEGNATLDAGPLRSLSLREVRDLLVDLLVSRRWDGRFPLLVGVWEAPVLDSPSVQLWIPEAGRDPVVEGVFSQLLEGPAGRFVGVAPSSLPKPWLRHLAEEAALLAGLFQELGYFGRCSFDALLVGRRPETAELHWIECNGRWGGTSLPMTLVTRLVPSHRPFFMAVDRVGLALAPRRFADVLARCEPLLYRPGRTEGIVFLTPTRVEQGLGYDFVALAPTRDETRALAARAEGLLHPP